MKPTRDGEAGTIRSLVRQSKLRLLAALVSMFLLSGLALPASAEAAPVPPPASDPFYTSPANLASAPPGTVFRSRGVTLYIGAVPLTGRGYHAYQLLYRTNSATGQPIANVTTVIVPDGAAPTGGRKVVSVQDAEDSLPSDCAPSYQMQVGEQAPNGDSSSNLEGEMAFVTAELAQGYEVVVPDPEGPDSEFLVKGMAAHAVLDSIRAVESFAPAETDGAATPVALWGYSGGAFESAAANELKPGYAPELNIVGIAAGGVLPANDETSYWLNNSLSAGYVMEVAIGINRAYPQMGLYSLLNASGKALAEKVSTGCNTGANAAPYANANSWTTDPNAWAFPQVQQVISENELGHAIPTTSTFYYNAIHDEDVWIKPLDQLVGYYCASGSPIDYYRDPVAQEHEMGGANFGSLAEAYMTARFAGEPVPDTCGQPGDAAAGTGLIPAPTINYAWSPTYILSHSGG
jgi:hypothetical protein